MQPPPQARWHAYADGEGHAFLPGKLNTRALCGTPRMDERYDHPITIRCGTCTAELNRLTNVALTGAAPTRQAPRLTESEARLMDESEARLMDGNR